MSLVTKRTVARRTAAPRRTPASAVQPAFDLSLGFTADQMPDLSLNVSAVAASRDWQQRLAANPPGVAAAIDCLSCAYRHLCGPRDVLTADNMELFRRQLEAVARSAADIDVETHPLVHQLLAAELALVLGNELRAAGLKAWAKNAVTLLNGEGLPHARHLDVFRPLLASWTRCRAMAGKELKLPGDDDPTQFNACVGHALRLLRSDGTQAFGCTGNGKRPADQIDALLDAAVRQAGTATTTRLSSLARSKSVAAQPARGVPAASYECEWSELAVLRSDWSNTANRLTVAYDGEAVRLELQAGRDLLWSGNWDLNLTRDGQPVIVKGPWHNVCWYSDAEVDYLELEARSPAGLCVQRQILLGKTDRFVYLADAVLCPGALQIDYRATLPLPATVVASQSNDTRDGCLSIARRSYSVQPLALPEWRRDPRGDLLLTPASVQASDGKLTLSQSFRGAALYAPLFIDLNPRRSRQPLTWRQLTIAEDRRNLPADVAVGYRVQTGLQQWLIYRSLGPVGNRTLLGHNLVSEFLFARFKKDGIAESLVEIE